MFKLFLNVFIMLEQIHVSQTGILAELMMLSLLSLHSFLFLLACDLFLLARISPQFLHCLHHKTPVHLDCRHQSEDMDHPGFQAAPSKREKNQSQII